MEPDVSVADRSAARPLAGVVVVEMGAMAAAAACGAQLAAWGATVVKVEPPWGERGRDSGAASKTLAGGRKVNPRFELHNRGKRSLAVDLADPRGRDLVGRLLERADAFVTNSLPRVLAAYGLSYEILHERLPSLVYGQITGFGRGTEDENRRSFDHGAFWAQSGLAAAFASASGDPPPPSGGLGDRAAGLALAGAVCAALLARERGGGEHRGILVTTSLLRTGLWLQGSAVSDVLATGSASAPDRYRSAMPTLNWFRCSDGRLVMLEVMDPERDWVRLVGALEDGAFGVESYGSGDRAELRAHASEVMVQLDRVFARRSLAEWSERLERAGILFEPIVDHREALGGRRVRAAGAVVPTDHPDLESALADPCTFMADVGSVRRAPAVGEDTMVLLSELGLSDAERSELVEEGVVVGAASDG